MIEKPIASNSSILSFVISFCLRLMQVHMSIPRGKMWSETDLVGSRNNSPQNSGQHELRDTANLRFLNANSPIDKTCLRTIMASSASPFGFAARVTLFLRQRYLLK